MRKWAFDGLAAIVLFSLAFTSSCGFFSAKEGKSEISYSLSDVREALLSAHSEAVAQSVPDYAAYGAIDGFSLAIGDDGLSVYEYESVQALDRAKITYPNEAGLWVANGRFLLDTSIQSAIEAFQNIKMDKAGE